MVIMAATIASKFPFPECMFPPLFVCNENVDATSTELQRNSDILFSQTRRSMDASRDNRLNSAADPPSPKLRRGGHSRLYTFLQLVHRKRLTIRDCESR